MVAFGDSLTKDHRLQLSRRFVSAPMPLLSPRITENSVTALACVLAPLGAAACGGRSDISTAPESNAKTSAEVVTIHGTVVDPWDNVLAGIRVGNGSQTTETSSDGGFVMTNVQVPYDIALVSGGTTFCSMSYFYQGMRSESPTFRASCLGQLTDLGEWHHATLTAVLPDLGTQGLWIGCIGSINNVRVGCEPMRIDPTANPTSSPSWWGSGPAKLQLYALSCDVDPVTNDVSRFSGYDWVERDLLPDDNIEWHVDLKPLPDPGKYIATEVALPPGYELTTFGVYLFNPIARPSERLYDKNSRSAHAQLPVPNLPDLRWWVEAMAVGSDNSVSKAGRQATGSTTEMTSLVLAPIPRLTSPEEGQDLRIGNDSITWEPTDGRATCIYVDNGPTRYRLCSSSNAVTMPDLSSIGVSSPVGESGKVEAFQLGYESVEDAALGCDPFFGVCRLRDGEQWGVVRPPVSFTFR
jgi:hypothetical protein